MKHLVFALVALTSCASWKQKDFVKELNKPSEEVNASSVASTPTDVKLLEKFKVQSVEEKKMKNWIHRMRSIKKLKKRRINL